MLILAARVACIAILGLHIGFTLSRQSG